MAGLKEFYCRSNETSLGSQFKWLEYTFNARNYSAGNSHTRNNRMHCK